MGSNTAKLIYSVGLAFLLLYATFTAVTPAHAQTGAPAQCAWPVAGNQLSNGLFADLSGWTFGGASWQTTTITGHPCAYTTALSATIGGAQASVTISTGQAVRVSFWVSGTGFTNVGVGYGSAVSGTIATIGSVSSAPTSWQFHSYCATAVAPAEYIDISYTNSPKITGVSAQVGSVPCELVITPTPSPTRDPFAVVTQTLELGDLPPLPPPVDIAALPTPSVTLSVEAFYDWDNITAVVSTIRTVPIMPLQLEGYNYLIYGVLLMASIGVLLKINRAMAAQRAARAEDAGESGTAAPENRSDNL